ncbi:MAG TPA: class I SAM-dependent methyltransferase, partial [Acidobacteriota bacterium]|nr:class I SAM-dependent methyltransferase [Acidobacteriota bacterium]
SLTKLISVDPHPRSECDQLCDEIVRLPLESVDLDLFQRLHPGDILFVDGSHRCFMNSDVTVFFLDVLPRIQPGVVIGIHDIFIPDDYPAEWIMRYYNEQYVLSSYLLGARQGIDVLWAAYYQCKRLENKPYIEKAAQISGCPLDLFHGCGFWFTRAK